MGLYHSIHTLLSQSKLFCCQNVTLASNVVLVVDNRRGPSITQKYNYLL